MMTDWLRGNERKLQCMWLFIIFLIFGITRLWQLTTLPLGIHIDEAGMAYDAWCLANFGVDRHMKSWPVYLINFSTGQSSLYAFLCAFLFRIAGYSVWTIRLPGVLFSFLTLVFGMKIARRLYSDNPYPALLVGSLVVILPCFIMSSRFGLDCNLMLGASTVFLYFFMTAIENGQKWRYLVSGIAGGILLYSYALTYIVLPAFLFFSLIYVVRVKKFSFGNWLLMALPMGVLAFPLILVQIVNYFDLPEMRIGIFTITKLVGYRISEIGQFSLENIITALKSIFIGDHLLFDSIPGIWNVYLITAILFVVGFVVTIVKMCRSTVKQQYNAFVFPLLWMMVLFLLVCFMESRTYRVNAIFICIVILAIEGFCVVARKTKKYAPIVFVIVCGIYAMCFVRFSLFYYSGEYTEATYGKIDNFGLPIKEGIELIETDSELSSKMTYVWEKPIFYAISVTPHPTEFNIIGDAHGEWRQYWFCSLGEIVDDCNYVLPPKEFPEYSEELRMLGFTESDFGEYSVFYKKNSIKAE